MNQFCTGFQLVEAGEKGRLGLTGAPILMVNGGAMDYRCHRQPVRERCVQYSHLGVSPIAHRGLLQLRMQHECTVSLDLLEKQPVVEQV